MKDIGMKEIGMDENQFEQRLRKAITDIHEEQEGRVNEMLRPQFVSCDFDKKEVVYEFEFQDWERNRVGNLHGGISSAMFDLTFGALTRTTTGLEFAPTLNLETTYIKKVPYSDTITIRARVVSQGRSITHLYGEAFRSSDDKLVATGKSSFFNADAR